MGMRKNILSLGVLSALALSAPALAQGQNGGGGQNATISATITTVPALGNVVSAGHGDTVFTIDPSTGLVTRSSGTGVRLTSGTTRAMVTVTCNASGNQCNQAAVNVKIGPAGSPTSRARTLTNFTVEMGSAVLAVAPTTGSTITFQLSSIGSGSSGTFYVGFDYPIAGNDSGLSSGAASSGFYVEVAGAPTTPTSGPTATVPATVFRPISLTNPVGLQFGTIVRPASGAGSVDIDATTGARTIAGGAVGLASPTPANATYTVTGEGGQMVSLSIPPSFVMTTPGGTATVTLTSTATGSQTLSSTLGSGGSFGFSIGGSMPVASTARDGAYSGTFTVSVQYN
jgi:hypothetical protein